MRSYVKLRKSDFSGTRRSSLFWIWHTSISQHSSMDETMTAGGNNDPTAINTGHDKHGRATTQLIRRIASNRDRKRGESPRGRSRSTSRTPIDHIFTVTVTGIHDAIHLRHVVVGQRPSPTTTSRRHFLRHHRSSSSKQSSPPPPSSHYTRTTEYHQRCWKY